LIAALVQQPWITPLESMGPLAIAAQLGNPWPVDAMQLAEKIAQPGRLDALSGQQGASPL
jgi:hypothetical protein